MTMHFYSHLNQTIHDHCPQKNKNQLKLYSIYNRWAVWEGVLPAAADDFVIQVGREAF